MAKETLAYSTELEPLAAGLAATFIQRRDLYAQQLADGSYVCVHKPLEDAHLIAHLQGEISVGTIISSGKISGNINASQKVHILAPGVIEGNIKTPNLIIEEGVTFDGKCEMASQKKSSEQKVVSLAERQ